MIRKLGYLILLSLVLLTFNGLYQIANKPEYVVSFFKGSFDKSPEETWETYKSLFKRYATTDITAEFLAGLAQIESKGNSSAVAGWRFRLTKDISRIYAPASSAVGLMQYTRDTFEDAKRFCFENKTVIVKTKNNAEKCRFNRFYNRATPSSVIEMTSARLHYYSNQLIKKYGVTASIIEKQKLASVIHLCGRGRGRKFVKARFDFDKIEKCGSHQPAFFYQQIRLLQEMFERQS